MLRLRAGTATLLIGPRSAAGEHGSRYALDSETDIHQRLTLSLQDPASREAIRRFWAPWQSDARLTRVKDHSIVERIARMSVRGPLIVFLVVDTSVNRRDTSASRAKQVAEALQNQIQFKPWSGPVKPPALVTVSSIAPAMAKVLAPVDRSIIAPPKKAVGDWTIAEKLAAIVVRTADSRKLSLESQQQLKGMLSDPKFVAWLIGSLLVWFVSQFFLIGEILDILMAGAALVLSGAGIFFSPQAFVAATHLVGQFVETTRSAKDEKDLDAAADIFAEIIAVIGIRILVAALAHATTRATSHGLNSKPSSVRRPPEQRPSASPKILARPVSSGSPKSPPVAGTKKPKIPKECSYLDKPYTVESSKKNFDRIRKKAVLGKPKAIKHSFPGDKSPQDALEYEVKIGDRKKTLIMPKSPPSNNSLPSAQQLADALGSVPGGQLDKIKQIEASPNPNPSDPYWAEQYNIENFSSAATGGTSGVTFYPQENWSQEFTDSTMIHESGHSYSKDLWTDQTKQKAWQKAMTEDGQSPSTYADSSIDEDFSESLVMYSLSKGTACEATAKQLYPNRYEQLDKLLKVGSKTK